MFGFQIKAETSGKLFRSFLAFHRVAVLVVLYGGEVVFLSVLFGFVQVGLDLRFQPFFPGSFFPSFGLPLWGNWCGGGGGGVRVAFPLYEWWGDCCVRGVGGAWVWESWGRCYRGVGCLRCCDVGLRSS